MSISGNQPTFTSKDIDSNIETPYFPNAASEIGDFWHTWHGDISPLEWAAILEQPGEKLRILKAKSTVNIII